MLLERCPRDTALRIAENVRQAVSAISLPWEGQTLSVGASLGVASLTAEVTGVDEWLAAADAACYAAKAAGAAPCTRRAPRKLRIVG
ncbi:diguanylate cyclase [Piscinibacter aquaticus]|uniref:diguanylate cyclase n=1 Tax=Piscinibacter aquaticus TaxID=392597 RepID=A0A5C6U3U6_9BURK|nr:diguanylate cyclase [Piscinibacter aquaticus]